LSPDAFQRYERQSNRNQDRGTRSLHGDLRRCGWIRLFSANPFEGADLWRASGSFGSGRDGPESIAVHKVRGRSQYRCPFPTQQMVGRATRRGDGLGPADRWRFRSISEKYYPS
jgi:hypothetical protein